MMIETDPFIIEFGANLIISDFGQKPLHASIDMKSLENHKVFQCLKIYCFKKK
jgi:hypothetical protein